MAEPYSRYSYPSQIEMDDEGDNDSIIDDAVLNASNPHGRAIERFLNDPQEKTFADRSFQIRPTVGSLLAGLAQRVPQPSQHESVSDLASSPSLSDLSTETDSLARFSTRDTTSSGVTSVSESAHQPDPSIMLGPIPSYHTRSVVGNLGQLDHPTPAHDNFPHLICILGLILNQTCHEICLADGHEALARHFLSHFHPVGPPGYVLCSFCNADFEDAAQPRQCWKKYAAHLYESHLRNGADIYDSRPDFKTLKYLLDKNLITQARYDFICDKANERKGPQYEHLMPPDLVPNTVKSREYLAEEEEYNRQNLVVRKNESRPRRQGRPEREGRGYHR